MVEWHHAPRRFPNSWSMFFNYTYFLCFYMWFGCTIYIKALHATLKSPTGKDVDKKQEKDNRLIWICFLVFSVSWVVHIITELVIIDYQPADYLTD